MPTAYRPPPLDGRLKGPSVKKKGGPASGGPQPVEDLASAAELVRGRPQMEVISGLLEEKGQPWSPRVPWSHQDEATSVTMDEWQQSRDQTDWRERVNAGKAVPVDTGDSCKPLHPGERRETPTAADGSWLARPGGPPEEDLPSEQLLRRPPEAASILY